LVKLDAAGCMDALPFMGEWVTELLPKLDIRQPHVDYSDGLTGMGTMRPRFDMFKLSTDVMTLSAGVGYSFNHQARVTNSFSQSLQMMQHAQLTKLGESLLAVGMEATEVEIKQHDKEVVSDGSAANGRDATFGLGHHRTVGWSFSDNDLGDAFVVKVMETTLFRINFRTIIAYPWLTSHTLRVFSSNRRGRSWRADRTFSHACVCICQGNGGLPLRHPGVPDARGAELMRLRGRHDLPTGCGPDGAVCVDVPRAGGLAGALRAVPREP
jgi:hypothetical protein